MNGLSRIICARTVQPPQASAQRLTATTHLVAVAASATAGYAAGIYDIIGVVVKAAEKYVVYDGIFEVLTDPATAGAYDPRTHARRVLDLIEAAMEGRIPNGMESYSIGGRSINKIPLNQLREIYEKYKQDVIMEEQAERLVNGRRSGKSIGVRFSRPSGINVQGYTYIG